MGNHRFSLQIACVALGLLLILSVRSPAMDYYVDAVNGDDANTGLAADQAWKTITHAVSEATPGTIHIAAGTYAASTNGETFPLVLKSLTTLLGAGADRTVLDAEHLAGAVFAKRRIGVRIQGLWTVSYTHLTLPTN